MGCKSSSTPCGTSSELSKNNCQRFLEALTRRQFDLAVVIRTANAAAEIARDTSADMPQLYTGKSFTPIVRVTGTAVASS
jgi:hypothetical protein